MTHSSSSNGSFPPHLSITNSILLPYMNCIAFRSNAFLFTSFYITTIILSLAVCLFLFYYGLQKCRQNCSIFTAASMSHSDSLNYHVATMELIGIIGLIICCIAANIINFDLLLVGLLLSKFSWYGENLFHVLTCVDRYFAVAHPFTYLGMKDGMGIRIKIIVDGSVWMLSFIGTALMLTEIFFMIDVGVLILSMTVICFCSLSVLCILTHPGPSGTKEKIDRSKVRAFYAIVTILGALVLRFAWGLIWALYFVMGESDICLILIWTFWLNLPSCLIFPLLVLQKKGKLRCCKKESSKKNNN